MKIAICDDDLTLMRELKSKIYDYSNLHNWESAIDTYECGIDLINSGKKYNIIILDYQMDDLNGLETAKLLRTGMNKFACIIFLTSFSEIAIPAYEVDTYRFVVKNTLYEGLFRALDDYRNSTSVNYDISVKSNREFVTINTGNITFLEVQNKDCYVHLQDSKVIHTKTALGKLFKILPHTHFFKVHKSYVINFKYLDKHNNTSIKIYNYDLDIPISRNYLSKFREAYYTYLKDFI